MQVTMAGMKTRGFSLQCLSIACVCIAALLDCGAMPALGQTGNTIHHAAASVANVYPLQDGFVDANGVMIYYVALGRGEPMLIVHGGPVASHDYFLPYLLPLARHKKLIFIDERGSGRSQKLEDPSLYTVENMVEDVEAVRQALGLGKITLLGHSYGGVLAQAYALKYQRNLSHFILCSTFYSTKEMNQVFVKMKENMPKELRDRIDRMEADG